LISPRPTGAEEAMDGAAGADGAGTTGGGAGCTARAGSGGGGGTSAWRLHEASATESATVMKDERRIRENAAEEASGDCRPCAFFNLP